MTAERRNTDRGSLGQQQPPFLPRGDRMCQGSAKLGGPALQTLVAAFEQRLGARIVRRTAEQLAARFRPERIASTIATTLHPSELPALRDALNHARQHAADTLSSLHLPHMPSRAELATQARTMFARTPSLDEIVDGAHELLLAAVGRHLAASASLAK